MSDTPAQQPSHRPTRFSFPFGGRRFYAPLDPGSVGPKAEGGDRPALGILLAIVAFASFSTMDALVKLSSAGYSVFQVTFTLSFVAFIALLVNARNHLHEVDFRPKYPGLVLLRAVGGAYGAMLGFYAFASLPLADAYALIFMVPLFVTVMSRIFLREDIGWRRWAAVLTGFAGVLVMVQPGGTELQLGHLAALGCAMMGAMTMVIIRKIGRSEPRTLITLSTPLAIMLFTLPLMVTAGVKVPTLVDATVMGFCGLCLALGQFSLFMASRFAPANVLSPFQYTQMIWAMLFGALLFGNMPTIAGVIGFLIILGSGLFTLHRQRIRRKASLVFDPDDVY